MGGRIVGIGGRLASGKDTVADYLVGKGWVKVGMSDVLHECAMRLNPYIPINERMSSTYGVEGLFVRYTELVEQVGYVEAKKNPEVRRFLQAFGTEVGRNMFGENFWVDIMARRLRKIAKVNDVIATGIRFPNEVDMINDLGGQTWWVDRDEHCVKHGDHSSETSVDPDMFEVIIENYGTLEELYHEVDIYR